MAIENVDLAAPTGKCAVDTVDTDKQVQYVKLMDPTDGSATPMGTGGGTEAAAQRVTIANDSTGVVSVDDNGGSLTVDGTVTANVTARTCTTLTGTKSSSGDNEVVAAPGANKRLRVSAFSAQNETTTALTIILRSAATTNGWRVYGSNRGDGMARTFHPGREWCLNTNEALNLNISAAKSCGYSVMYWTEDV